MAMIGSQFSIPGRREPSEVSTTAKDPQDPPAPAFKPPSQKSYQEAKSELEKHRANMFNQLGKSISSKLHSVLKQLDSVPDDSNAA